MMNKKNWISTRVCWTFFLKNIPWHLSWRQTQENCRCWPSCWLPFMNKAPQKGRFSGLPWECDWVVWTWGPFFQFLIQMSLSTNVQFTWQRRGESPKMPATSSVWIKCSAQNLDYTTFHVVYVWNWPLRKRSHKTVLCAVHTFIHTLVAHCPCLLFMTKCTAPDPYMHIHPLCTQLQFSI